MVINTANNIGIGTTSPNALLHIEKFINPATSLDLFNMSLDVNWGLRFQQSYTGVGNIQYNSIHKYSNVDYNSLTFRGGDIGIGNTTPTSLLHIKGTNPILTIMGQGGVGAKSQINLSTFDEAANAADCSIVATDLGNFTCNLDFKIKLPGAIGNTQVTLFRVANNGVFFANNFWHGSLDGLQRFDFGTNSTTTIRGHGTYPTIFRNGADNNTMRIRSNGAVGIQRFSYAVENNHMESGSLTIGNFNQNYGGGKIGLLIQRGK